MIEAFELKRKGYYKQAIEIYYKILSETNDDIEILSEIADLYYLLGNTERSKHYITKTLEKDRENISALTVLKKVYLSENDYENAEKIAKTIYNKTLSDNDLFELADILEREDKQEELIELTKDTTEPKILYKLALALYKLKRYDEVNSVLDKEIADEEPDSSDMEQILLLKGKVLYKQGRIEESKEVFKKLENIGTQTAEGLNYIGLTKLDNLELDEAIKYFADSVNKDSKNPEYVYNLGQAYFLKGWLRESKDCFNTAICLNPTEERYHYSLGYLYYKSGEYELAKTHLSPEYFESKVLLQIIKSEEGDLATSKIELEKMLAETPDNETILYALSKIYYRLDMYKQAKTLIEKVLELNPKPFEYKIFKIRILLKLNEETQAEEEIKLLTEKYPKYYYAKVLEAELNLLKKDYDSLFDTAQELIELDENHYEGYYYNALALYEKEDINFGIESLKKAISLDVNNAELYVKMSEFYQSIGRYDDAFAYIKEASDIDRSAKNRELYMQLATIIRKNVKEENI